MKSQHEKLQVACMENQINLEGRFASLRKIMKHKEANHIRAEEASKKPLAQSQSKNNGEYIRVLPTKLLRMGKDNQQCML